MSRFRMTPWTLSLGLLATAAYADDGAWAPAPPRPAGPAAQLGRPVALPAAAPAADPQLRPVSFAPVVRAQAPEAKPMPPGPPTPTEPLPPPHDWQRPGPVQQPFAAPALVPDAGPPAADCDGCCWFPRLRSWLSGDGCCFPRLRSWLCDDCSCGPGPLDGCGDCCWFPRLRSWLCDDCSYGPGPLDGCGGGCDGCGGGCCDGNRFYASGEYLLWWTKGDPLPPLVTAGSAGDLLVPGVSAGALGRPGTAVLFGNSEADNRSRSGGRFLVGYWFGDNCCLGIEGGGFFLGRQTDSFTATSFGAPLLARPFFNVLTGAQDAEFVAEPGNAAVAGVAARPPLAGTVSATADSSFWGAEANLRTHLWCDPCSHVDLIAGYKHLGLDETLTVSESLQAFNVATPFVFSGIDSFKATNRFNGGQLGLKGEWRWNRWSLDGRAIIAIGTVSEEVDVLGIKTVNGVTSGGDLLTQAGTNIGTHRRNRFAWSPEAGVNLGYQVTDHLRAFVGYDFLYLSDVVRAGQQVNLAVNPAPLAGLTGGPAQPAFIAHPSDFWAQGLNFGLEFRY